MTNGMATTKQLMKADMLGKGVWQRARTYFADRDIRILKRSALTGVGGSLSCIKNLDIVWDWVWVGLPDVGLHPGRYCHLM